MLLRLAGAGTLAILVAAPAYAGDPYDPVQRLTKADQARAEAAVLTRADLGAGWLGGPRQPNSFKAPRCPAYSPNQHDLVISGHAESQQSAWNSPTLRRGRPSTESR